MTIKQVILFTFLSFTLASTASAAKSPFAEKGNELQMTHAAGTLVFSAVDGRILRLTDSAGKILAGPCDGGNLWTLSPGITERNFGCFQAGPPVGKLNRTITASSYQRDDKTFSWLWDEKKQLLTLFYNDEKLPVRVRVDVRAAEDYFRIVPWISIDGPQSADFAFPAKMRIDHKTIDRFHVPGEYAVALTPQFFKEGRSFSLRYPIAFGDLSFWSRTDHAGPVAVFRSELDKPFMPSSVTLCGGAADPDASRIPCTFSRTYHLFAKNTGTLRCPQFDIVIGKDLRTVSRRYAQLRRLGPTLAEK